MPSYGDLAGLAGGSERVLRHDSKALALVLCFAGLARGPGTGLADLGYRAEPIAGATVFQRGSHCSAGQR